MPDLTHWDPLVHGTLIFGGLLPLLITVGIGWAMPGRAWMGVLLAVTVSLLCLFGLPEQPLTSDDYAVSGLCALLGLLLLERRLPARAHWGLTLAIVAALAWVFYPAWLSAQGGLPRKLGIVLTFALSVTLYRACIAFSLGARGINGSTKKAFLPIALLPAGIGVAILLVLGGAAQYGQAVGAWAASMGGISLLIWLRPQTAPARLHLDWLATFWACGLVIMAWGGWYFAEIQPLPTLLVLLSPLGALLLRRLPLPRTHSWQHFFWDLMGAALICGPVLGWVIWRYVIALQASEGY